MNITPDKIIAFWRDCVGERRWFATDNALDSEIRTRFRKCWELAKSGRLKEWENSVDGTLALLILLDQFPRNMFRGQARAFSSDLLARDIADRAIAKNYDIGAETRMRAFFYLPFMHSEHLADQERCIALIEKGLGRASSNYSFALAHRHEILSFGRFPGRNRALGRRSTLGEKRYLAKQSRKG